MSKNYNNYIRKSLIHINIHKSENFLKEEYMKEENAKKMKLLAKFEKIDRMREGKLTLPDNSSNERGQERMSHRAFSQNFQNSPYHQELMMSIQSSLERVYL